MLNYLWTPPTPLARSLRFMYNQLINWLTFCDLVMNWNCLKEIFEETSSQFTINGIIRDFLWPLCALVASNFVSLRHRLFLFSFVAYTPTPFRRAFNIESEKVINLLWVGSTFGFLKYSPSVCKSLLIIMSQSSDVDNDLLIMPFSILSIEMYLWRAFLIVDANYAAPLREIGCKNVSTWKLLGNLACLGFRSVIELI